MNTFNFDFKNIALTLILFSVFIIILSIAIIFFLPVEAGGLSLDMVDF